jgi:hypothetical protein
METAETQPHSPSPEDVTVEKMLRGFVRALLAETEPKVEAGQ